MKTVHSKEKISKTIKHSFKYLIDKGSKVLLATLLSFGVLTVNINFNDSAQLLYADDLTNTVPTDENYTTTINTYLNTNGYSARYGPSYGPFTVKGVVQSQSQSSATTFAAGLPLGTIFIDQSKIGETKGTINFVSNNQAILAGLVKDSSGRVGYDGTLSGAIKLVPNTINKLDGDLFTVTFTDAAVLANGNLADLEITYSNARIVVDQRYASAPSNEQYLHGIAYLAHGNAFLSQTSDKTRFASNSYSASAQSAVNTVAQSFGSTFTNDNNKNQSPYPAVGTCMDATYRIVNKDGTPASGTFVFAMAGINLDRDPDVGSGNNVNKPLWYSYSDNFGGENGKEYSFFSEAMSINSGIASTNIYVRPNNGLFDNPSAISTDKRGNYFYPNVSIDSNGKIKFISNAKDGNTYSGHDASYNAGFVTLADAAQGITVTRTGHGGGSDPGTMNTPAFNSKQLWYRYTSSTGLHGSIATTSEGNFKGTLSDGGTILEPEGKWDNGRNWNGSGTPGPGKAASHVVAEGKDVYYTMTPDIGYKISRLWIGNSWNAANSVNGYTEITFNQETISRMKKGDEIIVTTAAGHDGKLKYEENGTYTLFFPHAEHNEAVHVEWEPTTADILASKVWKDDNDKDGMRLYAYTNNLVPRFKLQQSINGGRTWTDVTQNAYGKSINEEDIPSGLTGSVYKDGTYTINKNTGGNHPYTWEYLPVYVYDSNGTADRLISYRIVEVNDNPNVADDIAIDGYNNAKYFDSQAFELTSEESKTWEGWQIYENASQTKRYAKLGDDKYYEVSIDTSNPDLDGVISSAPANPQPTESLSAVTSIEYRTVDKAIPYQSVHVLNEHDSRDIYVEVSKKWDDKDLKEATPTDGNAYQRQDLKFILSGTIIDNNNNEVDADLSGIVTEKIITTDENSKKVDVTGNKKIGNYTLYTDGTNQYAKVENDATYSDGYYNVSGNDIDYASGAVSGLTGLKPVKKGDGIYKIDDDNYGVLFEDLPTHYKGKLITYKVKEQINIDGAWKDAGDKDVAWKTTGGVLTPERDSNDKIEGYKSGFTNTPITEDVFVTLPLSIFKRDRNTKRKLEGAEFTVYLNAINGTKPLDDKDTKVEGQQIYTVGTTEYVYRNNEYYTFTKSSDSYTYTKADPQPKAEDIEKKVSKVESNTVISEVNGYANIKFLEPGTYYIKETKAPEGYIADSTIYEFVVDRNLKSIKLKSVENPDHPTKWWEKLYDLLFHDGIPADVNWDPALGTLAIDDEPLSASVLVRKYWEDNNDQDGYRPKDGDTKMPEVILEWTTSAHTSKGLPVYTDGTSEYVHVSNEYFKVNEKDILGSFVDTAAIVQPSNPSETTETCQGRTVYEDSGNKYVKAGGSYHLVNSVDVVGSYDSTPLEKQPIEANLELAKDGTWNTVTINNTIAEATVTYAGGPVLTDQHDAYTWNSIPAYRDGKIVTYRVNESSPLLTDGTYKLKYSHTSQTNEKVFTLVNSGTSISTHNQFVDVTNEHKTRIINLEAYKLWNDDDETKREEATLVLYKTVNGATSAVNYVDEHGQSHKDTGTVPTTNETDAIKIWKDLPVFEGGYPITYRIEETSITGYKTTYEISYKDEDNALVEKVDDKIDASEVKRTYYSEEDEEAGRIPEGKEVGDEYTTAQFHIENDQTIDIDVSKTWIDGANANVKFNLYRTTKKVDELTTSKFVTYYMNIDNGSRISAQEYNSLSPEEQASYTITGTTWEPGTADGWVKVDELEFGASEFDNYPTGDTETKTFKDLARQEVEKAHRSGDTNEYTVYTDGTDKYVVINDIYYEVNNGVIGDPVEDGTFDPDVLKISYLPYLYRILETPKNATRFADNQTSNTSVVNYNVHAGSGYANIEVVKELKGRNWINTDRFYFEMIPDSARDITDNTHSITLDEIPLPRLNVSNLSLYTDGTKSYIQDVNGLYRTFDTVTNEIGKMPIDPQPDQNSLTDTGNKVGGTVVYTIGTTNLSREVGAIGRAVNFRILEFNDETLIPREHTVEFNYKVHEVYDNLGTSIDEATEHTGIKDGITYTGSVDGNTNTFVPTEHNLKIVVTNDIDGKMTTTVLWDGSNETGAVPVYTNTYEAKSQLYGHIIKRVQGREFTGDDSFVFDVTNLSGAVLRTEEDGQGTITPTIGTAATITPTTKTKVEANSPNQNRYDPKEGDNGNYRATMSDTYTWIKASDLAHVNANGQATDTYIYELKEASTSKADKDDLNLTNQRIYLKAVITDNQDGTLNIVKSYHSEPSCTESSRIDNYVLVYGEDTEVNGNVIKAVNIAPAGATINDAKKLEGHDLYADANGNRYVLKEEDNKYYKVDSNNNISDVAEENAPANISKVRMYEYTPAALFTNAATLDIPVKKEWVGGPAVEDVELHLYRHLFELKDEIYLDGSKTGDDDTNDYGDDFIVAKRQSWEAHPELHEGEEFWTTEGYTYIARRGDFFNEDGTPKYDEGSTTTSSMLIVNEEGFNMNLPKYVTVDNVVYRAVYKLIEEDTSDAYVTTYRSEHSEDHSQDKAGDQIFIDSGTLVVTNTVVATNTANIAAVKQLLGRPWSNTDEFPFVLTPVGIGKYKENTYEFDSIDRSKASSVPMPARYIKNDDENDIISQTAYDKLSAENKANYSKEDTENAVAKITTTTVDPNGNLERLARFDEIVYTVNDLSYDPIEKHYQGDFFYTMKEVLPEISDTLYPVSYSYSTGEGDELTITEKEITNKQLPVLEDKQTLKTVKFSNGITYDMDEHKVHVKVRENRTGTLVVQIGYDETTDGDISSGTQFTPVYTNKYEASVDVTVTVNKYIMGRDWTTDDNFDFVMIGMAGAPFADANPADFPVSKTQTDSERETALEAGHAVHNKDGEHVKRLFVTEQTVNEKVQSFTYPAIRINLSDLNKVTTKAQQEGDDKLYYSDKETLVPVGTAYGQFMYAVQETTEFNKLNPKVVTDLNIDEDTEYTRITVIDKGDGTLDYYVEIFADRYANVPRYIPGTEIKDDKGVIIGGTPATNVVYVNQFKRNLSVTKAWDGPATEDVILKLQWSVNGTNWYDVSTTTWFDNIDSTKIIKKGATGNDLTVTWENLPAYANIVEHDDKTGETANNIKLDDRWIYYQVIEETPVNAEVRYNKVTYKQGDNINDPKYSVNPFHTGEEKVNNEYILPKDRVNNLYVTNFPKDDSVDILIGIVKQYIGKVWDNEEFTFEITPVKSKLASDTDYVVEGDPRTITTYENKKNGTIIGPATYDRLPDTSDNPNVQSKEDYNKHETTQTNKLPVFNGANGNEAIANKDTATVSVNEHAAYFDKLTIKRSDLGLNADTNIVNGEFIYKIKEVIPANGIEIVEDGKTYYVVDDGNGNKIKYTTDEHEVKIFVVDDGSGVLDSTIRFDDNNVGEIVPVYTNYSMIKTPVEGTKTWIGGESEEHVNGTLEFEDDNFTIKSSLDALNLKLQRQLQKDGSSSEDVLEDDAGNDIVIVWMKEKINDEITIVDTYALSADGETFIPSDDDPDVPSKIINAAEYEKLDETEKDNYIVYSSHKETIGTRTPQVGGDGDGPYTYTVKAINNEGEYVDPILNKVDFDGYEYIYSIREDKVPVNYDESYNGMNITNSYKTTSITGNKVWVDGNLKHNNASEVEPNLKLERTLSPVTDSSTWEEVDLANYQIDWTEAGQFTISKLEIAKEVEDQETGAISYIDYVYRVTENTINNYQAAAYSNTDTDLEDYMLDGGTITNTIKQVKITIPVTKKWVGSNTDEVKVTLYRDGIATNNVLTFSGKTDTQTLEFKDLDKYDLDEEEDGHEYIYTIKETDSEHSDYHVSISPSGNGFIITNSFDETSIPVTKVWKDNGNQDGIRPDEITIELLLEDDSTAVDLYGNKVEPIKLNPENGWAGVFNNVPRTDSNGVINYHIKESGVDEEKYEITYDQDETGFIVTNTHIPATVQISAEKVWKGDEGKEEYRDDVVLHLYGKAENGAIVYDAGAKTIELDNPDIVIWENIPERHYENKELNWTIVEEAVYGYTSDVTYDEDNKLFTVTNTYTGPTTDITVSKEWQDNDNIDSSRPESIKYQLMKKVGDEDPVPYGDPVEVKEDTKWSHTWTDLDVTTEIDSGETDDITTYVSETVTEEIPAVTEVKPVSYAYSEDGETPVLDDPDHQIISADEYDNQDGYIVYETETVVVEEAKTVEKEKTKEVTESKPIMVEVPVLYSVEEVYEGTELEKNGYNKPVVTAVAPGEYMVINSRDRDLTKVSVEKIWNDDNNSEGLRPDHINVQLLLDDEVIETAVITEDNEWSYTFEDLPLNNKNGKCNYSIVEETVDNYSKAEVYDEERDVWIITNSHINAEAFTVEATKVWADDADVTHLRKDVTFKLMKRFAYGEEEVADQGACVISLDDPNSVCKWTDLPAIEEGRTVSYTVTEVDVPAGYVSSVITKQEGNVIKATVTNTYVDNDKITNFTYLDPLASEGNMILKAVKFDNFEAAQAESVSKDLAPAPGEYEHYKFTGWDINYDKNSGYILVARYEPNDVLVTYIDPLNPNPITKSGYATDKDEINNPSDPSHSGFIFAGWKEVIDSDGNVIRVATYKCLCEESSSEPCTVIVNPVERQYRPPKTGIIASLYAKIVYGVELFR